MTRDEEIKDEIQEQEIYLDKYIYNIDSLLGKEGSNKVKKSMINYLVNKL